MRHVRKGQREPEKEKVATALPKYPMKNNQASYTTMQPSDNPNQTNRNCDTLKAMTIK